MGQTALRQGRDMVILQWLVTPPPSSQHSQSIERQDDSGLHLERKGHKKWHYENRESCENEVDLQTPRPNAGECHGYTVCTLNEQNDRMVE